MSNTDNDEFTLTDDQIREDLNRISQTEYIRRVQDKLDLSISGDKSLSDEPSKVLQKRQQFALIHMHLYFILTL